MRTSTLIGTRLTNCSPARTIADSSLGRSFGIGGVAFDDDLVVDDVDELGRRLADVVVQQP